MTARLRSGRPHWFEVVATGAIAHVELVADDRKQHRMRAEQQQTVGNRVMTQIGRELRRPPAVPAGAVPGFGVDGVVHGFTWSVAERTRAAGRRDRKSVV